MDLFMQSFIGFSFALAGLVGGMAAQASAKDMSYSLMKTNVISSLIGLLYGGMAFAVLMGLYFLTISLPFVSVVVVSLALVIAVVVIKRKKNRSASTV